MTPTDRARVLLELVEDCLANGKRDVAVEQLAKALREAVLEPDQGVIDEACCCACHVHEPCDECAEDSCSIAVGMWLA
jgi:hypothetical protein